MNTPGVPATGNGALELPPFSLDVQALDLGNEVKAVGLELVETENREPVRGKEGAEIWSEVFPGLAGKEDRKSTRLNSSHPSISYAVFCLKKKTHKTHLQSY